MGRGGTVRGMPSPTTPTPAQPDGPDGAAGGHAAARPDADADATLHLTRRTTVAYAFGSVGTGVFATVPGLVLAYYLTNTLGVAAGVAAFVVAVPEGLGRGRAADRRPVLRPGRGAGGQPAAVPQAGRDPAAARRSS